MNFFRFTLKSHCPSGWPGILAIGVVLCALATPSRGQLRYEYQLPSIGAGDMWSVGLMVDRTLMATGLNNWGQCNVQGWSNIVQIAVSSFHTVGLRADGRVVATGRNEYGQCNTGGLSNIVQIAAGYYQTLALREDGRLVSLGGNWTGQGNVSGWSELVGMARRPSYGKMEVGGWSNIIAVAAGPNHSVGLRADGRVIAVGDNSLGQCNVETWTNIVQISALSAQTIGVTANGIVRSTGENNWNQQLMNFRTGAVMVAAGEHFSIALRPDGTLFHAGANEYGQRNATNWNLGITLTNGFTVWARNLRLPPHERMPDQVVGSLGVPNLLAYTAGLHPALASPAEVSRMVAVPGGGARFLHRRSLTMTNTTLEVLSAGMMPAPAWMVADPPGVPLGVSADGRAEWWSLDANGDAPQAYHRLRATQTW